MKDFENIYSEYYDMVFNYVLSLCHDKYWVEEITQETFFKALRKIKTFRGECKLSVWLCQISKNTFYTMAKRWQRQTDHPFDTIPSEENLEQQLLDKDSAFQLHTLLHALAKPVEHYSLGMKQKLGIAHAIMEHQNILILDEPFNALDYRTYNDIKEIICVLQAEGRTSLMTSHSYDDLETLCTQICAIDGEELSVLFSEEMKKRFRG